MTNNNSANGDKISVIADIHAIPFVNSIVEEFLSENGISMKIQMQTNIVIDEIFSNIAKYSYGEQEGEATLIYQYCREESLLFLTFKDSGLQYNPLLAPEPDITLPAEDRDIGGLGLLMVRNIMDTVEYLYEGGFNILKMTKKI